MLWFNFILGLNFIFLCFKLIIIHYHTQKQNKIKFKPRIKLNHNIYIYLLARVQRKSSLQCLAFGQAEASINLLAQTSFQLAPKAFWRAELISQFFYYIRIPQKNITCTLGKLKTLLPNSKIHSPRAIGHYFLCTLLASQMEKLPKNWKNPNVGW